VNSFISRSGNAVTLSDSDNDIEGAIVAVTAVFPIGAGAIVDLIDFVRSLPFIFNDAISDDGDAIVSDKASGFVFAAGLICEEGVVWTSWIKVMIVCATRIRDSLNGLNRLARTNLDFVVPAKCTLRGNG